MMFEYVRVNTLSRLGFEIVDKYKNMCYCVGRTEYEKLFIKRSLEDYDSGWLVSGENSRRSCAVQASDKEGDCHSYPEIKGHPKKNPG